MCAYCTEFPVCVCVCVCARGAGKYTRGHAPRPIECVGWLHALRSARALWTGNWLDEKTPTPHAEKLLLPIARRPAKLTKPTDKRDPFFFCFHGHVPLAGWFTWKRLSDSKKRKLKRENLFPFWFFGFATSAECSLRIHPVRKTKQKKNRLAKSWNGRHLTMKRRERKINKIRFQFRRAVRVS